jgi:hypothetical protein
VIAASERVLALDRRPAVAVSIVADVSLARRRALGPDLEAGDGRAEVCAVVIGAALERGAFLPLVAVWIEADLPAAGGKETHGVFRSWRAEVSKRRST